MNKTHYQLVARELASAGQVLGANYAGPGVFEHPPPPSNSASSCRSEKRKNAFESSSKIMTNRFRSFFVSGQQ